MFLLLQIIAADFCLYLGRPEIPCGIVQTLCVNISNSREASNILPAKHSHGPGPLVGLGEGGDDDDEEADVNNHHDENGEVEKVEEPVSFHADEAAQVSYTWVEV